MARVVLALAVVALVLSGCGEKEEPAPTRSGDAARAAASPEDRALVERLRRGGLVIAFRHAATNLSEIDREGSDYADCSRQRNLNRLGKQQSRAIGAAFRALGIPIGAVRSSPYCRTRDTARLAFGRARLDRGLLEPMREGADPTELSMSRPFKARLEDRPKAGTNSVIVTHNFPPEEDAKTLAEGEAAVFRPTASGPELVGRVAADVWPLLARAFGS